MKYWLLICSVMNGSATLLASPLANRADAEITGSIESYPENIEKHNVDIKAGHFRVSGYIKDSTSSPVQAAERISLNTSALDFHFNSIHLSHLESHSTRNEKTSGEVSDSSWGFHLEYPWVHQNALASIHGALDRWKFPFKYLNLDDPKIVKKVLEEGFLNTLDQEKNQANADYAVFAKRVRDSEPHGLATTAKPKDGYGSIVEKKDGAKKTIEFKNHLLPSSWSPHTYLQLSGTIESEPEGDAPEMNLTLTRISADMPSTTIVLNGGFKWIDDESYSTEKRGHFEVSVRVGVDNSFGAGWVGGEIYMEFEPGEKTSGSRSRARFKLRSRNLERKDLISLSQILTTIFPQLQTLAQPSSL